MIKKTEVKESLLEGEEKLENRMNVDGRGRYTIHNIQKDATSIAIPVSSNDIVVGDEISQLAMVSSSEVSQRVDMVINLFIVFHHKIVLRKTTCESYRTIQGVVTSSSVTKGFFDS